MSAQKQKSAYTLIIEDIFHSKYKEGTAKIEFPREAVAESARKLRLDVPKNIGDLIYSFRYRKQLPKSIRNTAPHGKEWIIWSAGRAKYKFILIPRTKIVPNENLAVTKIPDGTPGVISMYALSDEQALLAILRYNRLIDIFTKLTCYSLQNHLRTSVTDIGQVETDEIYIGLSRDGAHFVIPIQAKGGRDQLSSVQILQDIELCKEKFPDLICRPLAAQFLADKKIALFEFVPHEGTVRILTEKHYLLVPSEEISSEELRTYQLLRDE